MRHLWKLFLATLGFAMAASGLSFAQDQDQEAEEVIVVTGTYIPRQTGPLSSPVAVVGGEQIDAIGAGTISDITQTLTINTGAQNNSDAFTQNVSTGTSNINLRGLGLSSTLVLLNGRRQVVSGAPSDLGLLFVDTSSLVPLIAIQRVEILKDGAAALYGSDAVAGVANFITRDDFEGLELSVFGQTVTEDSQEDLLVEGIAGGSFGRTHLMGAISYFYRTSLSTAERRFPGSLDPINGDFSNAGYPGSFIVPYLPTGLSQPIQDAWTATFDGNGNIPGVADFVEPLLGQPIVPGALVPVLSDLNCAVGENSVVPATFPLGFCRLDFGEYFDLVSEERRLQGYLKLTHEFGTSNSFFLELSGARNRAQRNNSPSFPIPSPQVFSDNNPFSPFGPSPVFPGPTTLPLFFIGRSVGQGPPALTTHDSDTFRIAGGFSGSFNSEGTWEVSVVHAENDFLLNAEDVLADRFALALNGLGGPNCTGGVPGLNGCQFFNPFGSSLLAAPGDTVPGPFGGQVPVANDPALIDWFTGQVVQNYTSNLTVVDAVVTHPIHGVLPEPIGFAFGVQYRHEKYGLNWDPNANALNYLFVKGGPDFLSTQDVVAVFTELNFPLHERVDLQFALRYENYDTAAGDTLDPKVGLFIEAARNFVIRGSFGTSFRGPNIFQQFGTQTIVAQLIDTLPGQPNTPQFFPVVASGNPNLVPETATNWNIGTTWEPVENLTIKFDWWHFKFTDIIVKESAQAIINANPLDPRITRSPITGGITEIDVNFVNASRLVTSGFDASILYRVPLEGDMGTVRFGFETTYINTYDLIDPQAGFVSGAGQRNFNNFGVSTPQWRFNAMGNWTVGQHDAYIFVRFIDSYLDDQNNLPIASHTTVDLQYNFILGDPGDEQAPRFTIGVINVFNNFPPTVLTNLGFDTKVHDPRGRLVYGKISKAF